MKLFRLRVRNFRCYKKEVAFEFGNITGLIGKNDIGKSTITDALNIFLNEEMPDKDDASKGGNGKDLTIICEFTDLPDEAVIDDSYPTSFKAEYLLNSEGRLEIHKTYSGHTAAPKCTGIFSFSMHPTADGVSDLIQLKNTELKTRAAELNIKLDGIDSKINYQLRKKIRDSIVDLKLQARMIPLNEDNAKRSWEGIKGYLPGFALFKSDRASTDQDPEAQDPLKTAVREAIKNKETELKTLTTYVESEVRKIAEITLNKIKEMDPSLAQQLNPQIGVKKWDSLFNVSITSDEDIPINKRGSGIKRLILLNFFRAKAELQAKGSNNDSVIYAVEEPETSQHPDNQRMLISALMELATDNQVIITTHTPMLARVLPDESLIYIHQKPDKTREVLRGGGETNRLFARSLGVLPDNTIKLFIGVEGIYDINFLKNLSKIIRASGEEVIDLEKMEYNGELIFFPLGGSSLSLWTSRLEPLCRPEFHLFDRDNSPPAAAKYQSEADDINRRDRCKAIITGKKEIENYLHYKAINEAYLSLNIRLNLHENFDPFEDVPIRIAENIHRLSDSGKQWHELDANLISKKVSKVKRFLSGFATPLMTMERLQQSDSEGNVLGWFAEMESLINN